VITNLENIFYSVMMHHMRISSKHFCLFVAALKVVIYNYINSFYFKGH